MAYTKQTWTDGDVITKDKLNHIEDGIANVETIKGDAGKSVKALTLTKDANGEITGGTMTLSDNSTVAVTVTAETTA